MVLCGGCDVMVVMLGCLFDLLDYNGLMLVGV